MASAQKWSLEARRALELKWRNVPPGIPADLAVELMDKLKAGSTIRRLTSGVREFGPALVSYPRFQKHCTLHPEWGAEAWRISRANGHAGKGSKKRALTHCKYGHPLSGDNLYIAPGRTERKCWACTKRRYKEPRPPSEQQIQLVTAALQGGESLNLICRGTVAGVRVQQPIFSYRKLKFYRGLNPEFDSLVISSTTHRRPSHIITARSIVRSNLRAPTLTGRIAAQPDETFSAVDTAVSRNLPRQIRDEVMGRLILDVLDGRVPFESIVRTARIYVREMYNDMNYGDLSLDERLFADGPTTRGDRIVEGLWT